jgi:cytochrome c oxidase subunit IV
MLNLGLLGEAGRQVIVAIVLVVPVPHGVAVVFALVVPPTVVSIVATMLVPSGTSSRSPKTIP